MADRVAIIGGSTPGRDHFPFPVRDLLSTPGNYTTIPFGVSLDRMCRFFYRVKKWHVLISANWTKHVQHTHPFPDPPTYTEEAATGSAEFDVEFTKEVDTGEVDEDGNPIYAIETLRESDLVVASVQASMSGNLFNFHGILEPQVTNVVLTGLSISVLVLSFSFINMHFSAGLFYTTWLFELLIQEGGGNIRVTNTPRTGDSLGAGNFTVDGDLVTPLRYKNLQGPSDGNYATLDDCNVAISPAEYWPYATKAGLPVYNTSTGAQLRDPLS